MDLSATPLPEQFAVDRPPGLLWAYAGAAGRTPVRLRAREIPAALEGDGWVWIAVDLIDQRAPGWVRDVCSLGPAATGLLAGLDGAPVLEHEDDSLHGIFPDFSVDFLRVSDSIDGFAFSVSDRLLVTGWRHPLAGVDAARQALRQGLGHASAFSILAAIVAGFCRTGVQRLRLAEADLDVVEDNLLAPKPRDERMTLKGVRRLALALHRPVAAMTLRLREAAEEAALPSAGAEAVEDMAARLEVLDQSVRSLSDRAKLLQEEIAAELAEESNRSLRALTVMTALMLPGTLVVGFFGMNTGGLPFAASGWGTAGAALLWGVSTLVFYRILVRTGAL